MLVPGSAPLWRRWPGPRSRACRGARGPLPRGVLAPLGGLPGSHVTTSGVGCSTSLVARELLAPPAYSTVDRHPAAASSGLTTPTAQPWRDTPTSASPSRCEARGPPSGASTTWQRRARPPRHARDRGPGHRRHSGAEPGTSIAARHRRRGRRPACRRESNKGPTNGSELRCRSHAALSATGSSLRPETRCSRRWGTSPPP